jgi:UDP-N-acetylglucosamine 4-epimerase
MSDWFITGAAGFIGSNLSSYLLSQGHSVIGFDNLSTGTMENIQRVQTALSGKFTFIEGDIRDPLKLDAVLNDVDVVVHLAAQVSVPKSLHDPEENNAINVDGFSNIITKSAKNRIRQIVYASSCAVYGDNDNLPLNENDTPNPLSPYAKSKLENERIAHRFARDNPGIQITGLRFFNIFGPWQNFDGGYASVVPRWLNYCLNNQRPEVFGDGEATRDFCFVDDVCAAIQLASLNLSGQPHVIYNIGSGIQTSLKTLFNLVVEEAKASGNELWFTEPHLLAPRDGDILHSCADISRARKDLSYAPTVNLAKGIKAIRDEQYPLN